MMLVDNNFLINQIKEHFDDYELLELDTDTDYTLIDNVVIHKNLLIIYCYDHLMYSELYYTDNVTYLLSETAKYVHNVAKTNNTKKVIFVTENVGTEREFNQLPRLDNLYTISTNIFVAVLLKNYIKLNPHPQKIKSDYTFMCLNGKPRPQRVQTVYYLIYKKLYDLGIISFLSGGFDNSDFDYRTTTSWSTDTNQKLNNFNKNIYVDNDYENFGIFKEDFETGSPMNNTSNFEYLRRYYEKSYIEIITCSTFIEPSFNLDEKYVNCVFGYVFPIIIGSQGYVQLIRDFGFDVFDDIIDHSYDNEPNPYYRLKYAIDRNNKILRDRKFLEEKFRNCIPRFEANIKHFKDNVKGILESRVQQQLNNITF